MVIIFFILIPVWCVCDADSCDNGVKTIFISLQMIYPSRVKLKKELQEGMAAGVLSCNRLASNKEYLEPRKIRLSAAGWLLQQLRRQKQRGAFYIFSSHVYGRFHN
jgi:hypothetical protein